MVEFGAQTHSRSLFLSVFPRICGSGAIELLQKRPAKKIVTSDRRTDRFRADREAGGTPFRPPKTQIPPAKALKTGSATKSEILLTSRLKSTSGTSLVCTRSKLRLRRNKKYFFDEKSSKTFWVMKIFFERFSIHVSIGKSMQPNRDFRLSLAFRPKILIFGIALALYNFSKFIFRRRFFFIFEIF